jgi:hypothetical protein
MLNSPSFVRFCNYFSRFFTRKLGIYKKGVLSFRIFKQFK